MTLVTFFHMSAVVLGISSHIGYFNKGEHHLHIKQYIRHCLGAVATGIASAHWLQGKPWLQALIITSQLAGAFFIGLYTSLLVYRIFLHPLRRFPGPFNARISSVWISTQLDHNLYMKLQEYHERYGLFVRTGSSDLSIAHPKGVEAIYGASSRCTKAAWYDFSHPGIALQNMRDPLEHAVRRKVWALAFSDRLLHGYEQHMRVYRQRLAQRLVAMRGQAIDVRKWMNLYSFDVMGALTFNKSFGSLERGEDHWAIRLLNATMRQIGLFIPIWLFLTLTVIPGVSKEWWRFLDFCGQKLLYRLKNVPESPDVSSALISHLKGKDPTPEDQLLLDGDARLIVVAGSDTTACTLACVLYELVRHSGEVEKLRAELTPYLAETQGDGEFPHSKIARLDHLNGVINEALRLYPPVPGALQRKTPPEGIMVDNVFVPGDMTVSCPQYVLGRSPLCYVRPEEFIPERWYKYPELIKDKTVFAPFTLGPYSCIGKPLAMLNLRTTVARLVMEFDMKLAHGEDESAFTTDAEDNFVLYMGALNLELVPRKAEDEDVS